MNGNKKALIVDDSMVMRQMIEDILNKDGFEVVAHAQDGEEAIALYAKHNPDLVTMDIVMPKTHGIQALKGIIQKDPDARIIVISGLHQKALVMEALEAGARDYVIKPFEEKELLQAAKTTVR
ncbi:MAG: response regulator [Thermoplasmata archaeon]|nr:response regulator [Thermoplasmata archaeon]